MEYLKLFKEILKEIPKNISEDIDWDDWDMEEEDDDKTIVNNKFTEFLINNDAYDKFLINIKKKLLIYSTDLFSTDKISLDDVNNFIRDMIRMRRNANISEIINNAFHWSSTPEGHHFWEGLHNEWKRISSQNDMDFYYI